MTISSIHSTASSSISPPISMNISSADSASRKCYLLTRLRRRIDYSGRKLETIAKKIPPQLPPRCHKGLFRHNKGSCLGTSYYHASKIKSDSFDKSEQTHQTSRGFEARLGSWRRETSNEGTKSNGKAVYALVCRGGVKWGTKIEFRQGKQALLSLGRGKLTV